MKKLSRKQRTQQESKNKRICQINRKDYEKLREYSKFDNEVAGIIIGKREDKKSLIKSILVDNKSLRNSNKYGVTRMTKGVVEEFDDLINEDNSIDWIGEWHTHPKSVCKPSFVDMVTIESLFEDETYNYPENVILIISGENCVNGWFVEKQEKKNKFNWNELEFQIIEVIGQ